jgi:hypothetical protein
MSVNGYSIMSDGTIFTITKDANGTCVKQGGNKNDVENLLKATSTSSTTGPVSTATGPVSTATTTGTSIPEINTTPEESKLELSNKAKTLAEEALKLINKSSELQMTDGVSEQEKLKASEQAIQAKTLAEEAIKKAESATEEEDETNKNKAIDNIKNANSLLEKTKGGSRSANKKNKITCKKKGGRKYKKSMKHKKGAKKC